MSAAGNGPSIIPHTFAYIFANCDQLRLIDLVEPIHSQTIGLVVSDRDPLSPLAQALLKCAAKLDVGGVKDKTLVPA